MREIPLTRGKVALVDDEDYDRVVAEGSWYATPRRQTFYACRRNTRGMVYMHRFITGAPAGMIPDHWNHDGLDNQRHNLKVVPARDNSIRVRGLTCAKTSRFRGVHRQSRGGAWRMQIVVRDVAITRSYATEDAAAAAYNLLAREHFGPSAVLNDVPDGAVTPPLTYLDSRPRGERARTAKLTVAKVVEIRRRYQAGESGASLGRAFGISPHHALTIGKGQFWPEATGGSEAGVVYGRAIADRPRACVVAVVRDAHGRILLGRRLKRDTGYRLWVLPGGGIDGRETLEEALHREVREECGVEIAVGSLALAFRHIEGPTNNVALFYHARYLSGDPVGGDDLGEPAFFTLTEIACLDLTPATREVLARIRLHVVTKV